MNIVTRLKEIASLTPHKAALVDLTKKGMRQISYSQLFMLTRCYAQNLQRQRLNRGAVVLLMMPLSLEFFAAMLAINSLGLVAMVVDPGSGLKSLLEAVSLVKPALIVVGKNLLLRGVARLLSLVSGIKLSALPQWPPIDTKSKSNQAAVNNLDFIVDVETSAAALITFTSGTTGRAKAIARSHDFLQKQALVLQDSLGLSQSRVAFSTLPIFTLAFLSYGTTTIFGQTKLTDHSLGLAISAIEEFKPDTILASPRFVQNLSVRVMAAKKTLNSVQKIYVGGAPVFASALTTIQQAFSDARIISVYGSSEAEPVAHLEVDSANLHKAIIQARLGSGICQGKPCQSVQLLILPRDWQEQLAQNTVVDEHLLNTMALSNHQIGAIVVSGEHVVERYLSGTAPNKIVTKEGRVWHVTGDAGYLDSQGELYLVGRLEQQSMLVKDRYPLMVEARAMTYNNIKACAYVEVDNKAFLVVTMQNNKDALESELLTFCRLQNIAIKAMKNIPVDKRHQSKVLYQKLKTSVATLRSVGADNARPFLSFKGFDLRSRDTYS